ncbi:MAG: Rod shape-determining protein MreC, partial [Pseudonocardiales bacterium]|nr:Rod shape-determining protein MreC [Pseudonocardiales bacterium]
LNPGAEVKAGDRLITGPGGSTSFVGNLAVGAVAAVRVSADGTVRADVTAATSPTRLDLVGVILVGGEPVTSRPALDPSAQAQR